jgi:hypothetical protein
MDSQIEKTLSSLRSRHIHGIYAENFEEANQKILDLIPLNAIVGAGDSTTLRQLSILRILEEKGMKVLDPFEPKRWQIGSETVQRERLGIMKEATLSDFFLTGTNAITQDGKIVNVDATGNRVAGMFWGHPASIIVVGRNKIVRNLDEAFHRIRKIIAPTHFRVRSVELGGKRRKTPCVATGECHDCSAVERGCNIFTIIEHKPYRTDIHVVIVNQDLGLGWDPSWPRDRINQILENYKRLVWVAPPSH